MDKPAATVKDLPDVDLNAQTVFECEMPVYVDASTLSVDKMDGPDGRNATEDIVEEHLQARLASEHFKDAVLDTVGVDFREHVYAKRHRAYRAKSILAKDRREDVEALDALRDANGDISIVGSGSGRWDTSETPLQRLRRLIFEADELEQDLQRQQQQADEGAEDPVAVANLLKHVHALQQQLKSSETKAAVQEMPSVDPTGKLLASLQTLSVKHDSTDATAVVPAATTTLASKVPPTQAEAAELDRRLAQLETLLGIGEDHSSLPVNLLATVKKMEDQVSLLSDPRAMDVVVKRCELANQEFDRTIALAAKAASIGAEPASDEINVKLQKMYEVMEKSEPWIDGLPILLDRLESLQALHASAINFGETLQNATKEQQSIQQTILAAKDALQKLELSMKKNQEIIQNNLVALEECWKGQVGK